jgi:gliding motility-associated-like protein
MYLNNAAGGDHLVTVTDSIGCQLLQHFFVDYKYPDCEIRVPGGLTPNGQFDNRLIIKGLEKYPNNQFKIFNRYGSLVFEAAPYHNDWDGGSNVGHNITESDGKLPSGTYYYILKLEPGANPLSGYIYLIKN